MNFSQENKMYWKRDIILIVLVSFWKQEDSKGSITFLSATVLKEDGHWSDSGPDYRDFEIAIMRSLFLELFLFLIKADAHRMSVIWEQGPEVLLGAS